MTQKAQKTPKTKKTKRASGEGTLRQRSSGIWELTIMDGFKEDGSRRYKTFYGKTQREAIEKRKAYQVDKGNGLNFETDYAFGEWADIWFDSHKDLISATTQESYRYTLRILNRFFETKKIRTIKAFDVERMLRTLQQEGRSAVQVCRYRKSRPRHRYDSQGQIHYGPRPHGTDFSAEPSFLPGPPGTTVVHP